MIFKRLKYFIFIFIFIVSFSNFSFAADIPNIASEAAILIDSSEEKVLYSKNEDQKMYPASITKIMTAIITIENGNLNDVVTVPSDAVNSIPAGYAIADLKPGEKLTVNQLLQVLMVHSANDAANVLAFYASGSIESFAELMNKKCQELGLNNTHFVNPSGMHNENHYSTARDIAVLMKYCMENVTFRRLASLKSCTIPVTNVSPERTFANTNHLLIESSGNDYYEYAIAGKTGFTTEAGNCLVSVASKNDLELICVVLGCRNAQANVSNKFIDSKNIFEYGFNNFEKITFLKQGSTVSTISVSNATEETKSLDLVAESDITVLLSKEYLENNEVEPTSIELNPDLRAPISQGQVVGKVVYNIDGTDYYSNLLACKSVIPSQSLALVLEILALVFILIILLKLLLHKKR